MAVKIRLARAGARNRPFYRIVVADGRAPRDGRFIELVGTYDPTRKPPHIKVKQDRVEHWLARGAKATEIVGQLIQKAKKAEASSAAES